MSAQDIMAVANILIGLLALGVVFFVTRQGLKHPERITHLLHDTPVIVIYLVGTWLLVPLGYLWTAGYVACVIACNLWFLTQVCPYCRCHGLGNSPSWYCIVAGHLAKPADKAQFASHFRRGIWIIALAWVFPPIGGIVLLWQTYGQWWPFIGSVVMLASFSLIAFWLVPAGAKPRCQRCANRANCPHTKPASPASG